MAFIKIISVLFLIISCTLHASTEETELPIMEEPEFRSYLNKRLQNPQAPETVPITLVTKNVRLKDVVTVKLKGRESEVIHLNLHDPLHRFINGKEFTPEVRPDKGTREVGLYRDDESGSDRGFVFCLKKDPEAPNLEFAHNLLLQSIVSAISPRYQKYLKDMVLPWAEIIIINEEVFLASKFIPGDNLEDILSNPEKIEGLEGNFNPIQLMVGIINALFTMPEDDRPQNRILCGSSLVAIDTERTFGPPYKAGDEIIMRAHSFCFCLPQMHLKLPKGLFYMKQKVLEVWWKQLEAQYKYHINLKEYTSTPKEHFTLDLSILPESRVRIGKTRRIINAGIKAKKKFIEMLKEISSELYAVYAPTEKTHETIIAGKPLEEILRSISQNIDQEYVPTVVYLRSINIRHYLSNINIVDADDDEDSKDESLGYQSEDDNDTVKDISSVASTNFATVFNNKRLAMSIAFTNTLLIDLGRVSKVPPKSAGTVKQIYGDNAHNRTLLKHRNLLRLLEKHDAANSTPDNSPRIDIDQDKSPRIVSTQTPPIMQRTLDLLQLIRQSSSPSSLEVRENDLQVNLLPPAVSNTLSLTPPIVPRSLASSKP